jgi:hypothetical protein
MFVSVDDDTGSASLAQHGDGDHLVGETAGLMSGHGALMRARLVRPARRGQSGIRAAGFSAVSIMPPPIGWAVPCGGFAGPVQAVHQGDAALATPGA